MGGARSVLENLTLSLLSLLPGFPALLRRLGTGGTVSARYCYAVWLRHLVMAARHGLPTDPECVAELGPGDSLGIGLAALISGAEHYLGFDVVTYAATERNLRILDELVSLFDRRAAIPDRDEFPEVKPYLESYEFPSRILDAQRLRRALNPDRLKRIERAVAGLGSGNGDPALRYVVPWHDPALIEPESVDLIVSQAVLEHVDDLAGCYRAMHRWLRRGGGMSHQIDLRCHGTAIGWDGHRAYSDLAWRIMRGRKPYLINREPHSTHIRLMQDAGFEVVCDLVVRAEPTVARERLAPRYRGLSEDDRTISGAFVQAIRR